MFNKNDNNRNNQQQAYDITKEETGLLNNAFHLFPP